MVIGYLKIYPPPPTLNFYSSGVQNTVYGVRVLSDAKWGYGGLSGAKFFFSHGCSRRRFFSNYYHVVGERAILFLVFDSIG
jgi:hypothetical protein